MLGDILEIVKFFEIFRKYFNRNKFKKILSKEIEWELKEFEEAYIQLLLDFYMLLGAYMAGNIITPQNPSLTINKINDKLNISIKRCENALLKLIRTLKVHEDDFKPFLEENFKRKILFKDIFEAVDVDNGNIDWKYLTSKPLFLEETNKQNKKTKFTTQLTQKITPTLSQISTNETLWNNMILGQLETILCDEDFIKDLTYLVANYYQKNYEK